MELLLRPDGLYERRWDKNLEPEPDYVLAKLGPDRFFEGWQHALTLEGKPKLKDLIAVLDELSDSQKETLSQILYCDVQGFIEESKLPIDPNKTRDPREKLDFLQVEQFGELRRPYEKPNPKYARYTAETPVFSISHGFTGYAYSSAERWGIGFTPVNELAELELVLSDRFEIDVHSLLPVSAVQAKLESTSWGTFLCAVFWEIGFHGSPSQRDAEMAVIKERLDDLDSGKAVSVPMDDLLDDLLSDDNDEEE